jgi:tetrapyrrole methylase family protein/MazG family protein
MQGCGRLKTNLPAELARARTFSFHRNCNLIFSDILITEENAVLTSMNRYSFSDLVDIMARLRAPGGCPWDREQTHESILSCLIEEAYEFVDAVERRDVPNMREELGDLLLQVVFHAEMASKAPVTERFTVEDVIQEICEKLIRRHPHVFGDQHIEKADEVLIRWDEIKKAEKGSKAEEHGALGELPKHLPALLKALKMQKRAAKTGFDWPDWKGPLAKVAEEAREFEAEAVKGDLEAAERELGDLLFSVVNLGRFFRIDPERALASANAKFVSRFQAMEKLTEQKGVSLQGMSLAEMDALWGEVKTSSLGAVGEPKPS